MVLGRTTLLTGSIWFLAATGAAVASEPTPAAVDPVRVFEGESRLELDVAALVDDLLPLVLEAIRAGAEYTEEGPAGAAERADRTTRMLEVLGVHALDRLRIDSEMKADREHTRATLTFTPGADAGVIGALAAVAPAEARFGRYLDADELDLLISVPPFASNIEALLDQLTRPEVQDMLPELPFDADGEIDLAGMSLRDDLLPLLAGEMHLLVLTSPAGAAQTTVPPIALVLAAEDGLALRDAVLDLAGRLAAITKNVQIEMVLTSLEAGLRAMPSRQVGDFSYQAIPGGPAIATNADWLIITTDGARFQQAVARADGLDIPKCRTYSRMPGEFLVKMLARTSARGEQKQPLLPMLQAAAAVKGFGVAEVTTGSRPGRIEVDARQTGRSTRVLYGLLHDALAAAPARIAEEREQEWLADTVGALDAALTTWGEDHEGTYPADTQELTAGGYLPVFPDLTPTPLGVYREHGYTYVPLTDKDGRVAGYYFFIYGGGQDDGYDVFTPDNINDPGHFAIEGDGIPDGVLRFCYDGTANAQVEAWNEVR
jgi:hypothetical protein